MLVWNHAGIAPLLSRGCQPGWLVAREDRVSRLRPLNQLIEGDGLGWFLCGKALEFSAVSGRLGVRPHPM